MANQVVSSGEGASTQPAAQEAVGRAARIRESGRIAALAWPTATLLALLVLWELLVRTEIVNPIIVPAATDVATALVDLLGEDYFWTATSVTLQETLIGFVIGVTGAWILGTLIGISRIFRLAFYPLVVAFQIMPRIALAPLFLTWFGFGITSKIVMAATICFFPVLINVVVGMQTVDEDAKALMRSFGASRLEEYRKLTLPSSLPVIFAGIKTAMTLALIGAIVAEFVGASDGMGVLIKTFNFQLDVAEGFAVIVALSIIGLILYGITELIENKIVFWRGH
ncbi:MAG TPA: ABC transporter permease [Solirubrobacteraceae bacterium]|nr:ABC transporter permease [Solirubrobacteraceae bacterium]